MPLSNDPISRIIDATKRSEREPTMGAKSTPLTEWRNLDAERRCVQVKCIENLTGPSGSGGTVCKGKLAFPLCRQLLATPGYSGPLIEMTAEEYDVILVSPTTNNLVPGQTYGAILADLGGFGTLSKAVYEAVYDDPVFQTINLNAGIDPPVLSDDEEAIGNFAFPAKLLGLYKLYGNVKLLFSLDGGTADSNGYYTVGSAGCYLELRIPVLGTVLSTNALFCPQSSVLSSISPLVSEFNFGICTVVDLTFLGDESFFPTSLDVYLRGVSGLTSSFSVEEIHLYLERIRR